MTSPTPTIRNWKTGRTAEPTLRVGVVLDRDAEEIVRIDVPDHEYELRPHGSAAKVVRNASLVVTRAGDAVALRIGEDRPRQATLWRIVPHGDVDLRPGLGLLVHGVMAGRGFHWQKRTEQTLCGHLELRPAPQGIVVVNELPLEQYLAGVITAEMSGACPLELLRAQSVVARSWLLAFTEPKHWDDPFDRCNDDCCQRYQGTAALTEAALDAVTSTRGIALVDRVGDVVDANYSKSCGGISELPEHVWGRTKPGLSAVVDAPPESTSRRFVPVTDANLDEYLTGSWLADTDVYCSPNVVPEDDFGRYLGSVDERAGYFRWTMSFKPAELEDCLRTRLPQARKLARLRDLKVLKRGISGRATQIQLEFEDRLGRQHRVRVRGEYRIREVLHPRFLYSSAFAVRTTRDLTGRPTRFTLLGAGWGHGAGMCQIGALGMALKGFGCEHILQHYYPEARLETVYH